MLIGWCDVKGALLHGRLWPMRGGLQSGRGQRSVGVATETGALIGGRDQRGRDFMNGSGQSEAWLHGGERPLVGVAEWGRGSMEQPMGAVREVGVAEVGWWGVATAGACTHWWVPWKAATNGRCWSVRWAWQRHVGVATGWTNAHWWV